MQMRTVKVRKFMWKHCFRTVVVPRAKQIYSRSAVTLNSWLFNTFMKGAAATATTTDTAITIKKK